MRKLATALALAAALSAQADEWTGPDKVKHFGGGALLGTAGTLVTESKALGFGVGCLTGLAKEVTDSRGGTGFSAKDLTVTCAGALLGAYFGGWLVNVTRNSVSVSKAF
jgi:putative lipoprotein